MPAVSIIIPCYNAEKYLDMCMESLLNQTLKNIEIICVDDGSTDRTWEKLNSFAEKDARVRLFSQQNQFAGAARNLGLSYARGEYLVFLDSDDFFADTLAQDAYSVAVSNDADVVLYDAQYFDEESNEFRKGWFLNTAYIPEKQPFSNEDCPEKLFQISTPSPWTKLFRRQFLLDTKLQFQTLRHTNDAYFILSALAMAKRIVTLDKVLVNYRVGHTTNLQSTKRTNPLCFYTAYKAWHDELKKLELLPKLRRSYVNRAMGGCLYNLRSMNDLEAKKIVFDKLREEIFDELEIPDQDVSCYFIESDYNEMHLIKNGSFEQYVAFQTSTQIRELWHSVERGIRFIRSQPDGTKARRYALSSVAERIIRAVKRCASDPSNSDVKFAYQIAHDFFNRKEFSGISAAKFQSGTLYQEFATIQKHDYATIIALMDHRLVVSLTSYPGRIHTMGPVLDSLYNQDKQADEIILWLAKEEFPELEKSLPEYLTELSAQNRLTIRWCDNLKPHKKYFYALQEYTEDVVVTVDDDLLYSPNMLSSLYKSYLLYPQAVSAVRVHLMLLSEENKLLPYNTWIRETDCCLYSPSMQLFATGGAGTLYPPRLFRKEFFDREAILENAPIADDLWLKAMELLSGVPVVAARPREPLQYLPGSQDDALKLTNDEQQHNDIQLANIIRWTDDTFGKDALLRVLRDPTSCHPILGMKSVTYHLDQERRSLRQQLETAQTKERKTKSTLLQTQQTLSQTDAKLKSTEAKLRAAETKLRETENKLKNSDLKCKETEAKLRKARNDVRRAEECIPINNQMKELGTMLKGLRGKGSSPLSVGFKYLVYAIAWIPEKILVFLMYYLRNGFMQTAKHMLRKLLKR